MFNFDHFKQKSPQQRFLLILGLAMFTVYFLLGIYFLSGKDVYFDIDKEYKMAFGILLIVYSAIRFLRLLKN